MQSSAILKRINKAMPRHRNKERIESTQIKIKGLTMLGGGLCKIRQNALLELGTQKVG
jgi:hypothetical protein